MKNLALYCLETFPSAFLLPASSKLTFYLISYQVKLWARPRAAVKQLRDFPPFPRGGTKPIQLEFLCRIGDANSGSGGQKAAVMACSTQAEKQVTLAGDALNQLYIAKLPGCRGQKLQGAA